VIDLPDADMFRAYHGYLAEFLTSHLKSPNTDYVRMASYNRVYKTIDFLGYMNSELLKKVLLAEHVELAGILRVHFPIDALVASDQAEILRGLVGMDTQRVNIGANYICYTKAWLSREGHAGVSGAGFTEAMAPSFSLVNPLKQQVELYAPFFELQSPVEKLLEKCSLEMK
jgi:hypothetical protein